MSSVAKVNLLLAIHCHQPVGNFAGLFSDAYEKAYLPFIDVLDRHPKIKVSFHYSGSLLDWLLVKHPEFIRKLKHLIRQGRIEIISGGYYEPILSLIPSRDACGQIAMLSSLIKEKLDFEPKGGWLAERVWEPKVPHILSTSGIRYTIIDDWHFKLAGFDIDRLSGYYLTEEEGRSVALFASNEKLRYLMPFAAPRATIDYLRLKAGRRSEDLTIAFGDDGEKFGFWPGTHNWVYKKGWLDKFFTQVENNCDWITTHRFSDFMDSNPPLGRTYIPCASYREMHEWSGGYFRNFFVKYPEANFMHKRMLQLSNRLKDASFLSDKKLAKAKRHLYMAQTNCSYWHGVFGGLYLNHLRSAVYSNLIEAEKILDLSSKGTTKAYPSGLDNGSLKKECCNIEITDFDVDAQEEIVVNNPVFKLCFKPAQGAGICEWDYKDKSLNLVNTIRRRPENVHKKVISGGLDKNRREVSSPGAINRFKGGALKDCLFYDRNPRYCFLEHFLDESITAKDFYTDKYKELGDFSNTKYIFETDVDIVKKNNKFIDILKFKKSGFVGSKQLDIVKTVSIKNKKLSFKYILSNQSAKRIKAIFAGEFNFSIYDNLLSRKLGRLKTDKLELNDIWNNIRFDFKFDKEAEVWHFPVETVSESESGIEKIYQELCLLFRWPVDLAPNSIWQTVFGLSLR